MSGVRRIAALAFAVVRRGPEVVWAPEWMGFGNLMYLAHWAYSENQRGGCRRVLAHSSRATTLSMFPKLWESVFVEPHQVRFTDRRIMPWTESARGEHVPTGPDRSSLVPFVENLVLPGSPILTYPAPSPNEMVVNIRRGDYYSVAAHRKAFGINIRGYVQTAVSKAVELSGTPQSLRVVSDDPQWCSRNLGPFLAEIAPTHYQRNDVIEAFGAISLAKRLIITNSTFSYWGGYVGDVLDESREVWAPALFNRNENAGRAYQLLSAWNVVEDVPGGWDPVE